MRSCIGRTFRADGFRGFFYGLSIPLTSIPMVNGVVFGAYAHANYLFPVESSFWKGIISGSYAGLVNTIVVTPVELIKIKMQVQSHDQIIGRSFQYKGSIDCARQIINTEGFQGLYKGGVTTIYREIPGYAMQFASFEISKSFFKQLLKTDELPMFCIFISGMVGGFNCWFWSYPQDVIKTKIQAGHTVVKGWDGGFNFLIREIWRQEGWIGFWRGFSAVIFRSTLPNGFGFMVNEIFMRYVARKAEE